MAGQQITGLTVEGYKSFGKKQHLEIRPLTLLAGANSSGKSSVLQPLLLLKQTLEAPLDPGPLKIDGPNVAFSWNKEMFTRTRNGGNQSRLKIGLEYLHEADFHGQSGIDITQRTLELEFQQPRYGPMEIAKESISEVCLQNGQEKVNQLTFTGMEAPHPVIENYAWLEPTLKSELVTRMEQPSMKVWIEPSRCFLDLKLVVMNGDYVSWVRDVSFNHQLGHLLTNILHVPGLRDPESVRTYPLMPVGERYPGPLHSYLASIIHHWEPSSGKLDALEQDLRALRLAKGVSIGKVDDTSLQILVGRYLPDDVEELPDRVNLADVGLGLSQVMPVLAALRVAQSHHLVVMEQPELHLHPRGVHRLAEVIVDAVNRGIRIIMETHSELLLLGVQTMVANGRLDPKHVGLNWFSLDKQGHSVIHQAELEQDGSFGDWPVDFLDVEWSAQRQYLDAASSHG